MLAERDVPLASVEMRDPGRFCLEDETMRELGHMVEVESPTDGTYLRHGALQTFSDDKLTFGPWEPLGGHTRSILSELGFGEAEVERLIDGSIVEAWAPA